MTNYRNELIKMVTVKILGKRLQQLSKLLDPKDPIYPVIKEDYCFIKNKIKGLIMEH